MQADNYYPFGLTFNSYSSGLKNDFLYNGGAERQDELDLNVDFTRYRMYDPAIGRWWQVDPKSDFGDMVSWSPYNYSFNNPIRYNDPFGDCPPGVKCGDVVESPRIRSTPNNGVTGGRFGNTRGRFHNGIDVLASKGTSLKSIHKGVVYATGEHDKLGNYIIVKSESETETFYTTYAHLDEPSTTTGEIDIGDEIGKAGKSGNAKDVPVEEEHVHISVKSGEKGTSYDDADFKNPEDYMKTQFDSEGNPDSNKLSAGQVQSIVDYVNTLIGKQGDNEERK